MNIHSVFCRIEIDMSHGVIYSARMYTAIETKTGGKEYRRELSAVEAGIAMRKLEKATGIKSQINYNQLDPHLTYKQSTYYHER